MNELDLLEDYKRKLIAAANGSSFVAKSFSRWYIEADRFDILPVASIVNQNDIKTDSNLSFVKLVSIPVPSLSQVTSHIYKNYDNTINHDQLARLRQLYTGKNYEQDKNKLIGLYRLLGFDSNHLAFPNMFRESIELFGSPFNTYGMYCSPFELERLFGSLGSYFEYEFPQRSQMYICNPPFGESIMLRAMQELVSKLNKVNPKHAVDVIITLPVWDSITQKEMGVKDYGQRFEAFEYILASKYFKSRAALSQHKYKYYDFYKKKYIPAVNTHLIIVGTPSGKLDINGIIHTWAKLSQ